MTEVKKLFIRAVRNSHISAWELSPMHLKMLLERRQESKPYYIFGGAFHCWILEPEKFFERYVLASQRPYPGSNFAHHGNAEWKEEQEYHGLEVISEKDFNCIAAMKESMLRNKQVKEWMDNTDDSDNETDFYWSRDGIPYGGRYDRRVGRTLIDFKTTKSAAGPSFAESVKVFKYYRQAGMYLEGSGCNKFYFVACEKVPPYLCRVFEVTEELVKKGQDEYKILGPRVWKCVSDELWDEDNSDTFKL